MIARRSVLSTFVLGAASLVAGAGLVSPVLAGNGDGDGNPRNNHPNQREHRRNRRQRRRERRRED